MIGESEHGGGPLGWLTVLQTIAVNRPELFGRREVGFKAPLGEPVYFSLDWEELSVEFVPGPAGVGAVFIKTRSARADRALVEAAARWGYPPPLVEPYGRG